MPHYPDFDEVCGHIGLGQGGDITAPADMKEAANEALLCFVSHERGKPIQLTSQARKGFGDVPQYEGAVLGNVGGL
jgi:hypothetical protein